MKKLGKSMAFAKIIGVFIVLVFCSAGSVSMADLRQSQPQKTSSLKEAFKRSFLIGAAISKEQILGQERGVLNLVSRQFNSITPENIMKWEELNPVTGQYDFSIADKLVSFAIHNNMYVVGHTLVWHQQTPRWVFEGERSKAVTRKELLIRLRNHIQTVVGRYKNFVGSWDVINEALNEDGSLRQTNWLSILGKNYIKYAFEIAHEADPNAKLYYNDYNLFKPAKRKGVISLVKRLRQQNVRIDGIGIQGHYGLEYPDLEQLEQTIKEFAELGLEVAISELDISVLPFPDLERQGADVSMNFELREEFDPYNSGLPQEVQEKLFGRYEALFELFEKYHEHIERVTFWGVHDGQSWRNYWPMRGRTDYPLLFDRQLEAKEVVNRLINQRR